MTPAGKAHDHSHLRIVPPPPAASGHKTTTSRGQTLNFYIAAMFWFCGAACCFVFGQFAWTTLVFLCGLILYELALLWLLRRA